jgi:ankyrin repeat protein
MKDPSLEKLNQALISNDKQTIEQMLAADTALVNCRDELGRVPLDMAVSRSHIEIVELLLTRGAIVNTQENLHGASPLMQAVCRNRPDVVELLLRYDANVNLKASDGTTALDLAKAMGDKEIIAILSVPPAGKQGVLQLAQGFDALVEATANRMINEKLDVCEIPDGNGLMLVRLGSTEFLRRRAAKPRVMMFVIPSSIGKGAFVLSSN